MAQNHVIDPTFFYDALAQFSFTYDIYVVSESEIDELGNKKYTYSKQSISGSLQSQGLKKTYSKTGNIEEWVYNFYCKSLYRIKEGDFIYYKGEWLRCESHRDYDEWGVRSAVLKMRDINAYNDLLDYVKYINGDIIV